MHHMYDETPQEAKEKPYQAQKIAVSSDAVYKDNVGLITPIHTEQVNQTQLRSSQAHLTTSSFHLSHLKLQATRI